MDSNIVPANSKLYEIQLENGEAREINLNLFNVYDNGLYRRKFRPGYTKNYGQTAQKPKPRWIPPPGKSSAIPTFSADVCKRFYDHHKRKNCLILAPTSCNVSCNMARVPLDISKLTVDNIQTIKLKLPNTSTQNQIDLEDMLAYVRKIQSGMNNVRDIVRDVDAKSMTLDHEQEIKKLEHELKKMREQLKDCQGMYELRFHDLAEYMYQKQARGRRDSSNLSKKHEEISEKLLKDKEKGIETAQRLKKTHEFLQQDGSGLRRHTEETGYNAYEYGAGAKEGKEWHFSESSKRKSRRSSSQENERISHIITKAIKKILKEEKLRMSKPQERDLDIHKAKDTLQQNKRRREDSKMQEIISHQRRRLSLPSRELLEDGRYCSLMGSDSDRQAVPKPTTVKATDERIQASESIVQRYISRIENLMTRQQGDNDVLQEFFDCLLDFIQSLVNAIPAERSVDHTSRRRSKHVEEILKQDVDSFKVSVAEKVKQLEQDIKRFEKSFRKTAARPQNMLLENSAQPQKYRDSVNGQELSANTRKYQEREFSAEEELKRMYQLIQKARERLQNRQSQPKRVTLQQSRTKDIQQRHQTTMPNAEVMSQMSDSLSSDSSLENVYIPPPDKAKVVRRSYPFDERSLKPPVFLNASDRSSSSPDDIIPMVSSTTAVKRFHSDSAREAPPQVNNLYGTLTENSIKQLQIMSPQRTSSMKRSSTEFQRLTLEYISSSLLSPQKPSHGQRRFHSPITNQKASVDLSMGEDDIGDLLHRLKDKNVLY